MWRSTTPSGGSVGLQRFVDQVEVTGGLTPRLTPWLQGHETLNAEYRARKAELQ